MRSTHSFATDFIIRKCKGDKTKAMIFARITVDGSSKEISIKEKINRADWDSKGGKVKGKNNAAQAINRTMDDIEFRIKEKYRMLVDAGALITAEIVKDAYLGIHTLQKGHKLIELTDYYKKIWEPKLKNGGFKNYRTTIEYIKLFLASRYPGKDIYLSQLNMQIATEFEYYIRNSPIKADDPCLGNGLAKHMQRFKRIINWAVEIEWLKNNPFAKYSCPIKKHKRKKLNFQQLVTLEQKVFTDENLNFVRDLFICSCYTGFAFADVMELGEEHFEKDTDGTIWCKVYRLKSDVLSPVPLMKPAAEIINRYKSHPESVKRGKVFPSITNQYVNRCLKVIKAICEIDIPLTFHIARHTFAKTVVLKNGVPLETVQTMMGHTKITTTQIYADVDEEKIMDDMSGVEEKIVKKRAIFNEANSVLG
jgi:integrase/recombinase XerD